MITSPSNMDRRLVERFESRQKFYTVLNFLLILWFLAQMIIYGVQIDNYKNSCSQVYNLGVYYIMTYLINFFVPVLAILASYQFCSCLTILNMVYIIFNIVLEVVVIIMLFTVGWRHVGMCFISTSIKIAIICICIVQILTFCMQFVLMYRRRTINKLKQSLAKSPSQNLTVATTGRALELNLIS